MWCWNRTREPQKYSRGPLELQNPMKIARFSQVLQKQLISRKGNLGVNLSFLSCFFRQTGHFSMVIVTYILHKQNLRLLPACSTQNVIFWLKVGYMLLLTSNRCVHVFPKPDNNYKFRGFSVTWGAPKWFFVWVYSDVFIHTNIIAGKLLVTWRAAEWVFIWVCSEMSVQTWEFWNFLAKWWAAEWVFIWVCSDKFIQTEMFEIFVTWWTAEWFIPSVHYFMSLQTTWSLAFLVTHWAAEWFVPVCIISCRFKQPDLEHF